MKHTFFLAAALLPLTACGSTGTTTNDSEAASIAVAPQTDQPAQERSFSVGYDDEQSCEEACEETCEEVCEGAEPEVQMVVSDQVDSPVVTIEPISVEQSEIVVDDSSEFVELVAEVDSSTYMDGETLVLSNAIAAAHGTSVLEDLAVAMAKKDRDQIVALCGGEDPSARVLGPGTELDVQSCEMEQVVYGGHQVEIELVRAMVAATPDGRYVGEFVVMPTRWLEGKVGE